VSVLESEHNAIFVVNRLEIDYRRPARLGDVLMVTMAVVESGKARLVAAQEVSRDGEAMASARVVLACVNPRTWRPARIPAPIMALMETTA
jgi:acyl-CoA thioester hydrolase